MLTGCSTRISLGFLKLVACTSNIVIDDWSRDTLVVGKTLHDETLRTYMHTGADCTQHTSSIKQNKTAARREMEKIIPQDTTHQTNTMSIRNFWFLYLMWCFLCEWCPAQPENKTIKQSHKKRSVYFGFVSLLSVCESVGTCI